MGLDVAMAVIEAIKAAVHDGNSEVTTMETASAMEAVMCDDSSSSSSRNGRKKQHQ